MKGAGKMITIVKVVDWTIPLFGNKRIFAYGKLLVSDGKMRQLVTTKEDSSGLYITFNRKRYRIRNNGSLYNPLLQATAF